MLGIVNARKQHDTPEVSQTVATSLSTMEMIRLLEEYRDASDKNEQVKRLSVEYDVDLRKLERLLPLVTAPHAQPTPTIGENA